MAKQIYVERDGPIATVVLNRPRKLNALTRSMWHKLGEAVVTLSADNDVRCVVLRGAGDNAFSPGNDIGEFEKERGNIPLARRYGADMKRTIDALQSCRHPIVALIDGICVGGGLELAANCDIRICGESSRFGAPINKLGLVMSYAELESLLNLVVGKQCGIRQPTDNLLMPASHQRGTVGDALRRRVSLLLYLVVGHHALYQSLFPGLVGTEYSPLQKDLQRHGTSDEIEQTLQLRVGHDQPELVDGHAESA